MVNRHQIALIGYGEQARRFYHPVLEEFAERHPLDLRLVVDLADREEAVRGFLAQRRLQPEELVLVDPAFRSSSQLPPAAEEALRRLHGQGGLDRLLVITEPRAHKPYVLWGAQHGLDVLCEKPLTAVDGLATGDEQVAWQLYEDWLEITEAQRGGRIVLMAHRRLHEAFRAVVDYLRDFIAEFEVPVTYVEGSHAEGVWTMPDEFGTRENHPFRYGYGKLLHSGYHYIELATRIVLLNRALAGKEPDRLELSAQSTTPNDFFAQFDADRYRALLRTDRFASMLAEEPQRFQYLGETDAQIIGQFLHGERALTSVLLSLLHTSVSNRSWSRLPGDLRKNGRRPSERLVVNVGHLLTVELTARPSTVPGGRSPFLMDIHRNAGVIGGEPFEQIRYGDSDSNNLPQAARREIARCWLLGEPVDCDLTSQGDAIHALSAIYASLARRRAGRPGMVGIDLSGVPVPLSGRAFVG